MPAPPIGIPWNGLGAVSVGAVSFCPDTARSALAGPAGELGDGRMKHAKVSQNAPLLHSSALDPQKYFQGVFGGIKTGYRALAV